MTIIRASLWISKASTTTKGYGNRVVKASWPKQSDESSCRFKSGRLRSWIIRLMHRDQQINVNTAFPGSILHRATGLLPRLSPRHFRPPMQKRSASLGNGKRYTMITRITHKFPLPLIAFYDKQIMNFEWILKCQLKGLSKLACSHFILHRTSAAVAGFLIWSELE